MSELLIQQSRQIEYEHAKAKPACDGQTDLFFSERTRDMLAAQLLCAACSNRIGCLEEARSNPPFAGVWGGVIFVNGEEQANKRGRGRPRKSESLDNARVRKALQNSIKSEDLVEMDGLSPDIAKQIA